MYTTQQDLARRMLERTDQQLLEMFAASSEWTPEALDAAREELQRRIVPLPPGGMSSSCLINSVGMRLVWIEPGSFQMGYVDHERKPLHKVTLSKGYYLQTTVVTQAQWVAVMGSNPSFFKGADRPVERVSWFDARAFLRMLNAKEGTLAIDSRPKPNGSTPVEPAVESRMWRQA